MARSLTETALLAANRRFYDALWSDARLVGPDRFNTWTLVQALTAGDVRCLEVGAGLRPRLPIADTAFLDISLQALRPLLRAGGQAAAGQVTGLPFLAACFDVVCAMDIVEHVDNDGVALAELSRVTAPGGILLLSVPLHQAAWSTFDELVGHRRRYEPAALVGLLAQHGFVVERSAPSGMLPRSSWLLAFGMWWLDRHRVQAMWWYNRVFLPLGLRRAAPLQLTAGLVECTRLAGVLLVCRRIAHQPSLPP